jgi:hypothetical protein
MTTRVFVDTSAWVAISDKDESHHTEARAFFRKLLAGPTLLVTSLPILAETQILIRRRLGAQAAGIFLKNVNESARIQILYPEPPHEAEARKFLTRYHDQDFSLADALSFVLMRDNEIKEAFTYDRHFATAGFDKIP